MEGWKLKNVKYPGWDRDREWEQRKRYPDRGSHFLVKDKPVSREIPSNPQI